MNIFTKFAWFNTHLLKYFWVVGIVCAFILGAFYIYDKYKFNKLCKQKELEKQNLINAKKA